MRLRGRSLVGLVIVILMVASVIVVALPRAKFEVSNLVVEPSEVLVGDSVAVSADIKNTGNAAGDYQATLTVNGDVRETRNLKMPARSSQSVSFTVTPTSPGEYKIALGGLTAILFVKEGMLPSLYKGDSWVYRVSAGKDESEVSYEVLGEATIEGIVTYVVEFSGKSPSDCYDKGTSFLDKGTLYPISEEQFGTVDDIPVSEKITIVNRQIQGSHWPLAVEGQWSIAWDENFTTKNGLVLTTGERHLSRTFKVEGVEDVTTAAGVFHCFKVVERDEAGNIARTVWYSDKIKNDARCELMVQGVPVTYELISYQVSLTPPATPPAKLDIPSLTKYDEPTSGYTISYPTGWELTTEEGKEGIVYIFTSRGARGLRFAWVRVSAVSISGEDTLDEVYEDIMAATKEADPKFELVDSIKVEAELPWYEVKWNSWLEEVKLEGKTIVALKDSVRFIVTGWVQEAYSKEYGATLDSVLGSFGISP